ncbi:MAG: putative quinol monooxygenase [Firmicutes bacterium]|jgi:autoinducer 2-degrading protein|nr:putative quinol monooxygenase [Bacillota bacterium]
MVLLMATYYCKAGAGDAVIELLREMAPLVKQHEPDCLVYEVFRSRDNADVIMLHELYRTMEALEAHRQTPYFQDIIEGRVIPRLERRERSLYDPVVIRE